jgi:hypothetical protein
MTSSQGRADERRAGGAQNESRAGGAQNYSRAGGAQVSPVPDDALMTVLPEARR